MTKQVTPAVADLFDAESQPVAKFAEQAYLDYSMYVILDRALPNISDGLKPVQRRIIYAMSELGLSAAAKYKKSARTVGDVLGKFHPHGDTACYEAMVLMAQNFSYRYPIIDGQGNWGSIDDPKSFAAMRYTEAKMSPYAKIFLTEINQGTVAWQPNFDGTLEEPKFLPAMLPNILLNGTTGIAVGMATDIPPHNLTEIVDACIYLLKNKTVKLADILKLVKAPDFPTEAEIITPLADIKTMYQTGHGSIKMRAVYNTEDDYIVVTALPHQVSGAKILEQIAQQMQAKKLPLVADLRDESDHEHPIRLLIIPRTNKVNTEELMQHLFATTDLERSYKVNLNIIGLNNKPEVKNLLQILTEWLEFRQETVRKKLSYRLDKILQRLHILAGLLIAYLNIDQVITIIRNEDNPKAKLMKKFKLTEIQANAILELKLRHLAKLEEIKIKTEQKKLADEQLQLEKILGSNTKLKNYIIKELTELKKLYGDKRLSPLKQREEAKVLRMEQRISAEPITVILSKKGWIRAAKGHEIDPLQFSYKSGDNYLNSLRVKTTDILYVFDDHGRSYNINAHNLPSARGYGEPLTGKLQPPDGALFNSIFYAGGDQRLALLSDFGYGFITKAEDLITKSRNGKLILKLANNSRALPPVLLTQDMQYLVLLTNLAYLLIIPLSELPEMLKGKGNKLINIPGINKPDNQERVIFVQAFTKTTKFEFKLAKKTVILNFNDLKSFIGNRAQRGHKLPKKLQKYTEIKLIT